jgi:hypothetical protein
MDEIVQTAKEEVYRNGYQEPIIDIYGRRFNEAKGRGLFFIEVTAFSQEGDVKTFYIAGAKLAIDNVFSRLGKVFLIFLMIG